jgi:tetrahydromethanopterin S-methyltransferase subunit G
MSIEAWLVVILILAAGAGFNQLNKRLKDIEDKMDEIVGSVTDMDSSINSERLSDFDQSIVDSNRQ